MVVQIPEFGDGTRKCRRVVLSRCDLQLKTNTLSQACFCHCEGHGHGLEVLMLILHRPFMKYTHLSQRKYTL